MFLDFSINLHCSCVQSQDINTEYLPLLLFLLASIGNNTCLTSSLEEHDIMYSPLWDMVS